MIDSQKAITRQDVSRLSCWSQFTFSMCGATTLTPSLERERDLFLQSARVSLDYNVPTMERILQNIYRSLTGEFYIFHLLEALTCIFLLLMKYSILILNKW